MPRTLTPPAKPSANGVDLERLQELKFREALAACETDAQRELVVATQGIVRDYLKALRVPFDQRRTKLDLSQIPPDA